MAEWLEIHSPNVAVGLLKGLGTQVLLLGFNAEQAEAFKADWSYAGSRLSRSSEFDFICCPYTPRVTRMQAYRSYAKQSLRTLLGYARTPPVRENGTGPVNASRQEVAQ